MVIHALKYARRGANLVLFFRERSSVRQEDCELSLFDYVIIIHLLKEKSTNTMGYIRYVFENWRGIFCVDEPGASVYIGEKTGGGEEIGRSGSDCELRHGKRR